MLELLASWLLIFSFQDGGQYFISGRFETAKECLRSIDYYHVELDDAEALRPKEMYETYFLNYRGHPYCILDVDTDK